MESLGKLFAFILTLIVACIASFYHVFIIQSIASLYQLNFITQFSFAQIYGLLILQSIIFTSHKENKKDDSKDDSKNYSKIILNAFKTIFTNAVAVSIAWGLSFIIYKIIS